MEQFLQQIASGLANGAIYACVALALVMIYVSTDHINFAQGEMAMFSTYISWQLMSWGVSFWVAFMFTSCGWRRSPPSPLRASSRPRAFRSRGYARPSRTEPRRRRVGTPTSSGAAGAAPHRRGPIDPATEYRGVTHGAAIKKWLFQWLPGDRSSVVRSDRPPARNSAGRLRDPRAARLPDARARSRSW